MEGTVAGVRIVPPLVEFFDAEVDVLHQMSLTVQNLSKSSKSIRFHGPSTNCFRLKARNPDRAIAPGLEVSALVEYYNTKAEDSQDRVILVVDNDVVEIPLVAYTPAAQLELSGPADFGVSVANGKVLFQEVNIFNTGSQSGEFRIKYSGQLPITIMPTAGVVKPGIRQPIKIEFISKTPGEFCEIANVKLEGQTPTVLEIKGHVVERSLDLLTVDTQEKVECINFGCTYYGTDKTESFLIHNNGPDTASFVAILEEGGEGQEVGVDLTKSTSAILASQHIADDLGTANELTSLVTALPSQGTLRPNETKVIHFKFSPRFSKSHKGFKTKDQPLPRRDYALFMHIETVGSAVGSLSKEGARVEVAVVGTALPVLVSVSPSPVFKFGDCPVGEQVDSLCTINNESASLPLAFSLQRVAHFQAQPVRGHIKAGQSMDVVLSFRPNQMGTFKSCLPLDVQGNVMEDFSFDSDPTATRLVTIHTTSLQLLGTSSLPSTMRGLEKRPKSSDAVLVAHPDDRATSIRPSNRKERIRTLLTDTERYTYVDPDYAYTDEEERERTNHKNRYLDYIDSLRKMRIANEKSKEFSEFNDAVELGIRPAQGLKPPKLSLREIKTPERSLSPVNSEVKLLNSKSLDAERSLMTLKKISDGLNAVPMTTREKNDCSRVLTPQQLKLLEIGPPAVDFGQVCLRSVSCKDLMISNKLDIYALIEVQIDCRELRQTSPLSQVVPPRSLAKLGLMFESNSKGKFERSVKYCINGYHEQHVVVKAEVVPVALQLSSDEIILKPCPGMPAGGGLRRTVTVQNKRNYPAEFTWAPVEDNRGTAFSIRPHQGTVEAFTSLECELVYHPTFSAPADSLFVLQVTGGSEQKLACRAEVGTAHCSFVERRLLFGPVPLHLTTTRIVSLKNTSQNHAYFEVVDTQPIPGMVISPKESVVPVGGSAELKVDFTPDYIYKFDTQIEVSVRGWKTISLRVGGTVEPPCVDIDVDSFKFGGVHCGALARVDFKLNNVTRTKANLIIDLSRFRDFSLKFIENDDQTDEPVIEQDGLYFVMLPGQQAMDCTLEFKPSEVASYDFVIPVTINNTVAPGAPPSLYPPTPAPSKTNWTISELATPVPSFAGVATPCRRVLATALRPPLQLSHSTLEFNLPSGYFELGIESGAGRAQGCMFVNNSDQTLNWTLHTKAAGPLLENGTFKFLHRTGSPFTPSSARKRSVIPDITLESGETFQLGVLFTPPRPGLFVTSVPVILNGNRDVPYRILQLRGELLAPSLTFDPESIYLPSVPLNTPVSTQFNIIAREYRRASSVHCEVPEVELEDGSSSTVLTVTFPSGQTVKPCCVDSSSDDPCIIPCKITFQSASPVSFSTVVTFVAGKDRYDLQVTATADNCLLTNFHFLAAHQSDFHIVRDVNQVWIRDKKTDHRTQAGEATFIPCVTPNRPSTVASTSATSTTFGVSSSSYQESSNGATSSTYPSTPHHEGHGPTGQDATERSGSELSDGNATYSLEFGSETEEKKFIRKVVNAVQRWFSTQGWAGGPYPILIPETLRSALQDTSEPPSKGTSRTTNWDSNARKETRTIFDLMNHLCGRPVPGIPVANTLPTDTVERVRHVHWMYCTLLTFLKAQGAMVASVKPEYLLDAKDYQCWRRVQRRVMTQEDPSGAAAQRTGAKDKRREAIKYEMLSGRAWTDLLAQLVKILILSRVTPQQFKKLQSTDKSVPLPDVNPDPLCSNVYSVGERIILAWINQHYEVQRQKPWPESMDGTSPPRRWIVNFDYDFSDGLVLAALVASHVPFVTSTHLHSMFTRPNTAEQCLHNVLKVVEALKHIGIDYDVQATDITEPNPIAVLLLCIHVYRRLPQYLPRTTVEFHGPLNTTVTKQVRLQNPSSKPLVYQVILAGRDAVDFTVPMGETVQVPAKGQLQLPVEFKSRFLRSCSAVLVLVGRRAGSTCGNTLVFTLETCINNITPVATIKCESPCYKVENVDFDVTNPFPVGGEFRIVLVEAKSSFPTSSPTRTKQSKQKKEIGAKTDHGQSNKIKSPRRELLPRVEPEVTQSPSTTSSSPMLNSFWSPSQSFYLDANGTATVEIQFLPFSVGHRQCSVLFINEKIGEFLYSIEANALLPQPSILPHIPSAHSVRISSAAAARSARGVFGGDERVVYWKCESSETFTEDLHVPLTNVAREKALAVAAQQRMSDREIQRRKLTGTLFSGTVTAGMLSVMGHGGERFVHAGDPDARKNLELDVTRFQVECSSKFYNAPSYVTIPASSSRTSADFSSKKLQDHLKDTIKMPVTFKPGGPGHYPCQIVLRSPYDIRVYQVESTVSPEGSALELQLTTPTHQSVTQDIPVANHTQQDWQLTATLEGEGFFGPPVIIAKALVTTYYPLMFRPSYEKTVEGKLTLTNSSDGTEQVVKLNGIGQKPLPLDNLVIECQARKSVTHSLQVPNVTKKKLTFNVMCDLNIVSGPPTITVLPGQTGEHVCTVSPWRRGSYAGVMSFVAVSQARDTGPIGGPPDSDSDNDDDVSQRSPVDGSAPSSPPGPHEVDQTPPYRLWYSVEVQASPPPPERTLEVTCAAHSAVTVEIAVSNPSRENVIMDVAVEGTGLEGEPTITVHPRQQAVYQLKFAPTSIGESRGSVTFQNELIGELWYDLVLKASTPVASPLPVVHCELGSSTYQMIKLHNPTDDNLLLTPSCSNTKNFSLELDDSKQLLLSARATIEIPLKFTPSSIGHSNHSAQIVFHSDQLGDWVFLASGTGVTPQAAEPINIYSELGGNSSIIIPFRNPTDDEVVVDVIMKERSLSRLGLFGSLRDENKTKESAFCLLLKHNHGITLAPNAILDIPISFAPDTMQQHEASITVSLQKQDGDSWSSGSYTGLVTTSLVSGLTWIYPIKGIPESRPLKESQAPCIECRARGRAEERVEVTLTGVAAYTVGAGYASYVRALTPIHLLGHKSMSDPDLGLDHINVPEEFRYELEYSDSESQAAVERSLGLSLVKKMKNQVSGVISLVFNFVFAPFKPFSHAVQLVVSAASGGVWRFPIRLVATEPEVDDTICIEAVGLKKDSVVGFRLNSQTSISVPFEAYFVPGSDAEFTVTPSSGRLLQLGSEGTLIKIVYKPSLYGKTHRAKLVIQTSDMQWTYAIIGTTPEYAPPTGQSAVGSTPHTHRRTVKQKKNYIRENLKLQNTAVSSPVKGVPLVARSTKSAHRD